MGLKDFMKKMADKQSESNEKIKSKIEEGKEEIRERNEKAKEKIKANNEKYAQKRAEKAALYEKKQAEKDKKISDINDKINKIRANNPNAGKIVLSEKAKEKEYQKERLKQLKRDHIPFCPKCKSTQLTFVNKKLSIGRALLGGAALGETGAILGGITSKKGKVKCLNCGHTWKL
ncbi:hypothetical protein [Clostridium pasteurianum]|uniref:Uncharacterized protein n=1 Tax=Clostridium pasteurianum BC1 TaxID=86416 RepID=R4K532_CLOPA|nr:hypothetical protein [Clostridium pasteurianum]AGK95634.1 hypothetical protein Clopa_0586 [Clostridium pasteurianum BC1]